MKERKKVKAEVKQHQLLVYNVPLGGTSAPGYPIQIMDPANTAINQAVSYRA